MLNNIKMIKDIERVLSKLTKKCPICNKFAKVENRGIYFSETSDGARYYADIYLSCDDYLQGRTIPLFDNSLFNYLILRVLTLWNTK